MSWTSLLANNTLTALVPTKSEIDKLRALAARSLSDVAVPGLSTDMQFILAYDAARTLSLIANAELGVSPGDHWRVWLWGKNLSNRLYETEALYSTVGWGLDYGPPRTYGVNFSYKL